MLEASGHALLKPLQDTINNNYYGDTTMTRKASMGRYKSDFENVTARKISSTDGAVRYEPIKILYIDNPASYIPDFVLKNGIVIEAKGYFDPKARTKMLRVKEQYPELDIRFLFQNAQVKLSKSSKTTYGQWATTHGFKWAHAHIPDDWFNEPPANLTFKTKTLEELVEHCFNSNQNASVKRRSKVGATEAVATVVSSMKKQLNKH